MSLLSLPPELILRIFKSFDKEKLADCRLVHRYLASILLPNLVNIIKLPLSYFLHVKLDEPLYNEDAEDFTGDEDDFATSDRLKVRFHVKKLYIVYETSDIDNGVRLTSRSIPTVLESLPSLEKVFFHPTETYADFNVRMMLSGLREGLKGTPFNARLRFCSNVRDEGIISLDPDNPELENSSILRELPGESEELLLKKLPENGAQTLNEDLVDVFERCLH